MLFRYSEGLIRVLLSLDSWLPGNFGGTKGKAGVAPLDLVTPPCSSVVFLLFLVLSRSEGLITWSSWSANCPNIWSFLVKEACSEAVDAGPGGGGGGATGGLTLALAPGTGNDMLCFNSGLAAPKKAKKIQKLKLLTTFGQMELTASALVFRQYLQL